MNTKTGLITGVAVAAIGLVSVGCGLLRAMEHEKRELLRVGVYDSRGVAIAYAHSRFGSDAYDALKAQLDNAAAAGDTQAVKAIKEQAKQAQHRKHLQGFGTAPVHEYVELIKEKLPELAAACSVDVIVSKWEFDYLTPDAAVRDITHELVALFEPNERALKIISHLKDWDPLPEKEISEHVH